MRHGTEPLSGRLSPQRALGFRCLRGVLLNIGGISSCLQNERGGEITDDKTARNLIAVRERQLKGPQARVDNLRARELWGGAAGTDRLAYRWPNAQRISRDILVGAEMSHA